MDYLLNRLRQERRVWTHLDVNHSCSVFPRSNCPLRRASLIPSVPRSPRPSSPVLPHKSSSPLLNGRDHFGVELPPLLEKRIGALRFTSCQIGALGEIRL